MTSTVADILGTASTTIVIPTGRFHAVLVSYAERSLSDIANVIRLEHGNVAVISKRPVASFAQSERLLWSLLADMVSGNLSELLAVSDATTLGSLADLWARLTLATYAS